MSEPRKPWSQLTNAERMSLVRSGVKKATYEADLNKAHTNSEIAEAVQAVKADETPKVETPDVNKEAEVVDAVTASTSNELPVESPAVNQTQAVEVQEQNESRTGTTFQKLMQPLGMGNKKKPIETDKFKRVGGVRWWLVITGGVSGTLGIAIFAYFMSNPDAMILGMLSVIIMLGAGIALKIGFTKQDEGMIIRPGSRGKTTIKPGKTKAVESTNALNIYSDKVAFENIPDEVDGKPNPLYEVHPRRCQNDNRYYYVNIYGTAFGNNKTKLVPFTLPDTQYRDPREFSNNLNIPAHRKLAIRRSTLFQKLSPIIIVVAMVVVAVLWVATTPAVPETTGQTAIQR